MSSSEAVTPSQGRGTACLGTARRCAEVCRGFAHSSKDVTNWICRHLSMVIVRCSCLCPNATWLLFGGMKVNYEYLIIIARKIKVWQRTLRCLSSSIAHGHGLWKDQGWILHSERWHLSFICHPRCKCDLRNRLDHGLIPTTCWCSNLLLWVQCFSSK